MGLFVPSRVVINSEILRLVQAIATRQGELAAYRRHYEDQLSLEAVAAIDAVHFSTKTEGNLLTRVQVTEALREEKRTKPSRDLKEVLNYSRVRRIVRDWSLSGRGFNEKWVLSHHAELLKGIVTGKLRGHYRQAQCVIKDGSSGTIVYMPPEANDVFQLMNGLLSWLRQQMRTGEMVSVLVAAQFHFEFVTIHPFMDGNGRLARLLTNAILAANGYDVERFAALEKQHEVQRSVYYRSLRVLQAGNYYEIPPSQNIQPWIVYWLQCLHATYVEALSRVAGSRPVLQSDHPYHLESRLRKAEALFRRHIKLSASEYSELLGVGRTQAVADLNALVKACFVVRVGGGRSTIYQIKKTPKT